MVSDLLEEKEELLREAEQLKQRIADLEKEVIVWKKASENNSYEDSHEGKWVKRDDVQRLTKAKEIIKELLNSCFGYNSKTVNYEVKAKAEQFVKESEVEK